jgi:hypothetical protein
MTRARTHDSEAQAVRHTQRETERQTEKRSKVGEKFDTYEKSILGVGEFGDAPDLDRYAFSKRNSTFDRRARSADGVLHLLSEAAKTYRNFTSASRWQTTRDAVQKVYPLLREGETVRVSVDLASGRITVFGAGEAILTGQGMGSATAMSDATSDPTGLFELSRPGSEPTLCTFDNLKGERVSFERSVEEYRRMSDMLNRRPVPMGTKP